MNYTIKLSHTIISKFPLIFFIGMLILVAISLSGESLAHTTKGLNHISFLRH